MLTPISGASHEPQTTKETPSSAEPKKKGVLATTNHVGALIQEKEYPSATNEQQQLPPTTTVAALKIPLGAEDIEEGSPRKLSFVVENSTPAYQRSQLRRCRIKESRKLGHVENKQETMAGRVVNWRFRKKQRTDEAEVVDVVSSVSIASPTTSSRNLPAADLEMATANHGRRRGAEESTFRGMPNEPELTDEMRGGGIPCSPPKKTSPENEEKKTEPVESEEREQKTAAASGCPPCNWPGWLLPGKEVAKKIKKVTSKRAPEL
ncbi:unnamed protein product [Linum trigynum]